MKMVAMTTLKLKIPWENQVIEIKWGIVLTSDGI